jgi:hypothetical protein
MAPHTGRRTGHTLRHAFPERARRNRFTPECAQEAAVPGQRASAAGNASVAQDCGHLDFLVAGYDTSHQLASTMDGLTTAFATMTDDDTVMFAGTADTAHDEGFEDVAGWCNTLATTGHSPTLNQTEMKQPMIPLGRE